MADPNALQPKNEHKFLIMFSINYAAAHCGSLQKRKKIYIYKKRRKRKKFLALI